MSSAKVRATNTMAGPSLVQSRPQIRSKQPFSLKILFSCESVKLKGLVNLAFVGTTPKSPLKKNGFRAENNKIL